MGLNGLDEYWVPEHVREYLRGSGSCFPWTAWSLGYVAGITGCRPGASSTTVATAAWKLTDLDTVYRIEDHEPMTLGQMLDGIDEDLIPSDQTMYEDLLWAFGAWDTLEQMDAAMATRVYVAAHDGTVGFKLVK